MTTRLVLFGWLTAVLMAVGCDTAAPTPAGDRPPADTTTDEAANGDSALSAPEQVDDVAAPTAEVDDHLVTPVAGVAATGDAATEPAEGVATGPTLEDFQQRLMEAAQAGDLATALEITEAAVAAFPDDVGMQINRFAIRLRSHNSQEEEDDSDAAAQRYLETAAVAEELQTFGDQLPPQIREIIPYAYYHKARAYAHQGKVAESLAALKVAVEGGVSQLSFADDKFMAPVHDDADFQQGLTTLRQEAARRAIAEADSFAFDFELPDLDEKPVKMGDFKGKLLIVDFWGTWCPPCRDEIPHFIKLKESYPEDLEIVGISYEHGQGAEVVEHVRKFADEQGINYALVIGDQATQEKIPDLSGYPTTLFLDRTGKVRLMIVGYHSYEMLDAYVAALLQEDSVPTPAG